MAGYRPNLDESLWAQLRPFVETIVTAGAAATTYSDKELYAVVTPLAVWMHTKAGLELDAETALDPYTIDQFVMLGLAHYTKAGRGTMRSRLRRLSEALVPELGEKAQERTLGKSQRVAPYTTWEVTELRAWARALPPAIAASAGRLLALGFGAGLQGSEIGQLEKDDITIEDGVLVHVGGARPRDVPVLVEWEHALEAYASSHPADKYVFRVGRQTAHRNAVTNFVAKHGGNVPLQARRMRASWIIQHLNGGTPVTILLPAAGLTSAEGLDPYLPWGAPPPHSREQLRNPHARRPRTTGR